MVKTLHKQREERLAWLPERFRFLCGMAGVMSLYRKGQELTTQEAGSSAPTGVLPQKIRNDFNTRQHEILQTAAVEGARDDGSLEADVTAHDHGSRTSLETAQQAVNARQAEITADTAHLSQAYQTEKKEFDEARQKETARQEASSAPGTLSETKGENNHTG